MRLLGILAAAVVAALALAACGDEDERTIDTGAAEETVARVIADESGFEATDMECPEDVEAVVGVTFECEFTGPEGPYTATVRITEVEGDDATFIVKSRPTAG